MKTPWTTAGTAVHVLPWLLFTSVVQSALTFDVNNLASVKNASRVLTDSVMRFYDGDKPGQTPGLLPVAGQFNWWEAGAMFGQVVEYWYYTGDSKYNEATKQALLFQAGPDNDYQPKNQTLTEGNDDQAFWAMAAMSAAEMRFPNPDGVGQPSWLSLAQAVFNRQAGRWDDKHCNGGLRWQFNPMNKGWMQKNTISNGCFFQLAARLARYTGNDTYAFWADKTYDWLENKIKLITDKYEVFDGVGFTEEHCNEAPVMFQWSYNIGTILAGSAFMYNYTNGAPIWRDRIQGFLNHVQNVFFPAEHGGKIMFEYACEIPNNCNKDQRSFKGYLSRWLAVTAQLAPFSQGQIMPWLKGSAVAAGKSCVQTGEHYDCGLKWIYSSDDGQRDIGHQMTAMSVVQSTLILSSPRLADIKSGNSSSDPNAGGNARSKNIPWEARRPYTTGDKVGGWILTVLAVLATGAGTIALLAEPEDLKDVVGGARVHRHWR